MWAVEGVQAVGGVWAVGGVRAVGGVWSVAGVWSVGGALAVGGVRAVGGVQSVEGVWAMGVMLIVEDVLIFEVMPVGKVVLCGVVLVETVTREVLNVDVWDILFNSLVKGDGIFISLIIQTVVRGVLNSALRIASPALLPLRHSSSLRLIQTLNSFKYIL